jgi:hypothetical protein
MDVNAIDVTGANGDVAGSNGWPRRTSSASSGAADGQSAWEISLPRFKSGAIGV